MTRKHVVLTLSVGLLLFLTLACSLGGAAKKQEAAVPTPEREVVVNEEAADQAQEAIQEGAQSNTIRLSESQFTSYLQKQLDDSLGGESTVQNLTVWFDPGQITLEAEIKGSDMPIEGNISLTGNLQVVDGRMTVDVKSASINGMTIPTAVLQGINTQLNDSLATMESVDRRLKNVIIEEGYITIEMAE